MIDHKRKYPVHDCLPGDKPESIESLEKAGFKRVKNAVIMDDGSIWFMLIDDKWRPVRYD